MSSAGWYPDPSDGTQLRYWDGSEWTDHQHPADVVSTPGAAEVTETAGTGDHAPPSTAPEAVVAAPPVLDPATTSLLLGLLSLVLCGFFTGVPAIVIARRAAQEIDESDGELGGRGVATAGLVTGLIGTILSGVVVLFVLAVLLFSSALHNTFGDDCGKVTSSGTLSGGC